MIRGTGMKLYSYDGPIMLFDTCVSDRWIATTYAVSKAKARSNLTYQAKKHLGRVQNVSVTLPGEILLVG